MNVGLANKIIRFIVQVQVQKTVLIKGSNFAPGFKGLLMGVHFRVVL